jgi:hypothetical protein
MAAVTSWNPEAFRQSGWLLRPLRLLRGKVSEALTFRIKAGGLTEAGLPQAVARRLASQDRRIAGPL